MTPQALVQEQLEAYNARDLARFIAVYDDQVTVFRPPLIAPTIEGKAAFAAYYATQRFSLPELHATVINRIAVGNKVIDHERITGLEAQPVEVAVAYEIVNGLIATVWIFAAD